MRTFIQKGYCHKEMNEPENAVEEFKKGILSAKGRDMNLLLLARYAVAATYESMGKLADAIEQWEEINKANPRYRDVLQKLDQYKDLRGDDNLKDFLVCPAPHFEELCRRIIRHLSLEILELKLAKTSLATAIAVPREADKRTIMRQRVYCKINRDAVNFGISEVKQVIEEAKTLRCTRAIYISPMSFGNDAIEFSSGRQITLIGGKELSKLLGEIDEMKETP
jgi:tetratricopeptide (TPR) repeat protein